MPVAIVKRENMSKFKDFNKKLEANNRIKDAVIAEKERQLRQCREDIQQQSQQLKRDKQQLERESSQVIQEKERQLGQLTQQLEESEQLVADFVKEKEDLKERVRVLRRQARKQNGGTKSRPVDRASIKLTWREGKKAPCDMERYHDAAVCMTSYNNMVVYCVIFKHNSYSQKQSLYTYHAPTSEWSLILDHPLWSGFAVTVIDGQLTTVGGVTYEGFPVRELEYKITGKLFSLSREGSDQKWIEKFPPMPTKRFAVSTLCTGTALIVAGGRLKIIRAAVLTTVEVLNTETQQWYTTHDLPQPLCQSSLILCGDLVYLLGGYNDELCTDVAVYSCSLISFLLPKWLGGRLVCTLTQSSIGSPWKRIADLPVKASTAVTFNGRLLVIGGLDAARKPTTAVHMYQSTTNSWEVISHMTTPRSECLAAVLPDNQLMVVGGRTIYNYYRSYNPLCDSIEFGT
jgi:hypothetical protein